MPSTNPSVLVLAGLAAVLAGSLLVVHAGSLASQAFAGGFAPLSGTFTGRVALEKVVEPGVYVVEEPTTGGGELSGSPAGGGSWSGGALLSPDCRGGAVAERLSLLLAFATHTTRWNGTVEVYVNGSLAARVRLAPSLPPSVTAAPLTPGPGGLAAVEAGEGFRVQRVEGSLGASGDGYTTEIYLSLEPVSGGLPLPLEVNVSLDVDGDTLEWAHGGLNYDGKCRTLLNITTPTITETRAPVSGSFRGRVPGGVSPNAADAVEEAFQYLAAGVALTAVGAALLAAGLASRAAGPVQPTGIPHS